MAADVVFTAESPWYTNSHMWRRITEYALFRANEALDDDREYLDVIGLDFTFLPDGKAVEAGWFSGVIEMMLAEGEFGSSEADREHVQELIRKLHSEIRARGTEG